MEQLRKIVTGLVALAAGLVGQSYIFVPATYSVPR